MRLLFGLLVAGSLLATLAPVHADEWCGFLDKKGAPVRCGFSSLAECKQVLGDKKDTVCMPSPSFAKNRRAAGQATHRI
jgi:hypothetical protein